MARAEAGRRRAAGVPPSVYRVLDANLNRAREGLRVLEDTARFVWDSPDLFRSLRSLRHALDRAARAAYPKLVSARDSERDEGRTVPEKGKRDLRGLVAANFRRAQEALRVLEEYGKVVSPGSAAVFKKVRFKLYAAEKAAAARFLGR
jgi:thiamine-phosphate pyrophosphorylase